MTTEQFIDLQNIGCLPATLTATGEVRFHCAAWTISHETLAYFRRSRWVRILPTNDVKLSKAGIRRVQRGR